VSAGVEIGRRVTGHAGEMLRHGDHTSRGFDIALVRHGETEWTISGRHTSHTDRPLTAAGRDEAVALGAVLGGRAFGLVLSSPMRRALETCRLAGYEEVVEVSGDVAEWDYGDYEGRTTAEIRADVPGWTLWTHGVPNGETPAAVAMRADRVIARARLVAGHTLVFSHGHFLRALAARWLGLDTTNGRLFALSPGSLSALGWEREQAVVKSWNLTP
jgi:probable phosphoglycerate mutase